MKQRYRFTKNYIKEYPNAVSPQLAAQIISQKDLAFHPATIDGGKINSHRNCLIKKLDPQFNDEISLAYLKVFKSYIQEFKFFNSIKMEATGYDHVLYLGSRSQEYKEHVDFSTEKQFLILTCSLILNDDYDGGDFKFFEGEYTLPKKACSAVVFPSNFCFPHAITPVLEGDRHSIINWIK